jgi:hypothetical protein
MWILALGGVLACALFSEPQDSGLGPSYGDCDPDIKVPTGVLADVDTVDADRHQDVLGAAPTPFHVHYSWPDRDPSRSGAFLWRTDVDTLATQIQISKTSAWPDGAEVVHGRSFLFGSGTVGEGTHRMHEVRLCGTLEPNTTYTYRVGGEGAWSPAYEFSTPGAPGTFESFRVAMAGDSRGAYDTWEASLVAMEAHDPDFYLFSGDMVQLGINQAEWDAWFDASGELFASKALVTAHGNHEFLAQNYFAQFAFPGNEEWFAIDYGNLLLLTLNDTVAGKELVETVQPEFMDAVLSASDSDWQIAMHHQAAYSACTVHGSSEAVQDAWVPVWDAHEVDLVLAGHNHIYERSVPIRDGVEAADGTVYVVSGGAGAPLYSDVDESWFGAVANPIEHYVILDFTPGRIEAVVRDLEGNVLDQFVIER